MELVLLLVGVLFAALVAAIVPGWTGAQADWARERGRIAEAEALETRYGCEQIILAIVIAALFLGGMIVLNGMGFGR